ncbi:MAG TPA: carbonic anhydrase [Tepidisphaeraceae bacterium]|jgi:hypothetical protein
MNYTSPLPYNADRVHAGAIYCADGRMGEHFDDFMQNGLKLPRYDRIALPGGPACLAGHVQARLEEQGVVDELNFLIEAHRLSRIVLIQHQACAFYQNRLGVRSQSMEQLQVADLTRAAFSIRHWTKLDNIEGYFCRVTSDGVVFEKIDLT